MKKVLLIIFIILTTAGDVHVTFSWDSTAAKYMPLQVGNTWVYKSSKWSSTWYCYAYEKYKITGTAQINNRVYYLVNSTTNLYNAVCSTQYFPVASRLFQYTQIRIDSATTNIYSLNSCIIDSLASTEGDSLDVCQNFYTPVICDTSTLAIFGLSRPFKNFIFYNIEVYEIMQYAKDIGLYRYFCSQPGPSGRDMVLQGCVINGVLYGDTNTLVGINIISSEVPNEFTLSQNYPNPFNPTTKLKFQMSKSGLAKLTVYDALGKEVRTLVNQQLSPGTYEVDFDGSSLPSAVYYYKLESDTYTETKKMVLIK